MKCPHCKKDLDVPSGPLRNADTYGNTCKTVTNCCGQMVYVRPIRSFEIVALPSKVGDEDDWGRPVTDFKKK